MTLNSPSVTTRNELMTRLEALDLQATRPERSSCRASIWSCELPEFVILKPLLPRERSRRRRGKSLTKMIMVSGASCARALCFEFCSDLFQQICQAGVLPRIMRHHATVLVVHGVGLWSMMRRGYDERRTGAWSASALRVTCRRFNRDRTMRQCYYWG